MFKLVFLKQTEEHSDERVPEELLGQQHKREEETNRSLVVASSKASCLLNECFSIAVGLY